MNLQSIGQVSITVSDLDVAIDLYGRNLGLQPI